MVIYSFLPMALVRHGKKFIITIPVTKFAKYAFDKAREAIPPTTSGKRSGPFNAGYRLRERRMQRMQNSKTPATPPNSPKRRSQQSAKRSTGGSRKRRYTDAMDTNLTGGKFGSGSKYSKKFPRGVRFCLEHGGTLSARYKTIIQHTTTPNKQIADLFAYNLFQQLLIRAGSQVWDRNTDTQLVTSDIIRIYYNDNVSNSTGSSADWVVGVATKKATDFITWFTDSAQPWNSTLNTQATNFVFLKAELILYQIDNFNRLMHSVEMDLLDARVYFEAKSSLKIQNQSTSTDGDEDANDVENVPLYGKKFISPGNGFTTRLPTSTEGGGTGYITQAVCDESNGVFLQSVSAEGLQSEPLQGYAYHSPKKLKYTKIGIAPGVIKTSILTYKYSAFFSKFWSMLKFTNKDVTSPTFIDIGKTARLELEKMLEVGNGVDIVDFKIGYEHDLKCSMSLKSRNKNITMTDNIFI